MGTISKTPAANVSVGGFLPNPINLEVQSIEEFENLAILDNNGNEITRLRQRVFQGVVLFDISQVLKNVVRLLNPYESIKAQGSARTLADKNGVLTYSLLNAVNTTELFLNCEFGQGLTDWTQQTPGLAWVSPLTGFVNYTHPLSSPPVESQTLGQFVNVTAGQILTLNIVSFITPPTFGNLTFTAKILLDGIEIADISADFGGTFTKVINITQSGNLFLGLKIQSEVDAGGPGTSAVFTLVEFCASLEGGGQFTGNCFDIKTNETEQLSNDISNKVFVYDTNPAVYESIGEIQKIKTLFLGFPYIYNFIFDNPTPADVDCRVNYTVFDYQNNILFNSSTNEETATEGACFFRNDFNFELFNNLSEKERIKAARISYFIEADNGTGPGFVRISKDFELIIDKTKSSCFGALVAWFSETGSFETYYFNGYFSTRAKVIKNGTFLETNKRINTITEKAKQESIILNADNITTADRVSLESIFSSEQVFLYDNETDSFNPINILTGSSNPIEQNQNIHELNIEAELQISA